MAFTFKIKLVRTPMSLQTDGTYWYVGCDDGKIYKITIADNTTATLATFAGRKITALCSDGTSLYVGFADGGVHKVTISNGALTLLEPKSKGRFGISTIHYNSTTLSIGSADGKIYTRATT